jgi:hypothetical protein
MSNQSWTYVALGSAAGLSLIAWVALVPLLVAVCGLGACQATGSIEPHLVQSPQEAQRRPGPPDPAKAYLHRVVRVLDLVLVGTLSGYTQGEMGLKEVEK